MDHGNMPMKKTVSVMVCLSPELPLISWTLSYGYTRGFELQRADVVARLMQLVLVIEHFDGLKELDLGKIKGRE